MKLERHLNGRKKAQKAQNETPFSSSAESLFNSA
jgi:hypothetical protein